VFDNTGGDAVIHKQPRRHTATYLLLRIHKSTMIRCNSHHFTSQTIVVGFKKEPTVTQPCALQVELTSEWLKSFKPRATDQITAEFIQKRM